MTYSYGRFLVPFLPLTAEEYRTMKSHDRLDNLDDQALERLWLNPVQRWMQIKFRINQGAFSATTTPTLEEMTEDFMVACAIMVDKVSMNPEDSLGFESVGGAGKTWDHLVPPRAAALLARHSSPGVGVVRG